MFGRSGVGTVGVVTDSTACLPQSSMEGLEDVLRVVPLTVTIDDAVFVEGIDVTSDDVASAHANGSRVITSRPSPARFLTTYRELAETGCSTIVSWHASSKLSSTVSAARLAALESPVPVEVVDTGTLGMCMGFAALTGARWASEGRAAPDVLRAGRHVVDSSRIAFYVDSLEPLRRGGRIGRAGTFVGSALSIKPLLHVAEGAIQPLARVRSSAKAVERLGAWGTAVGESLDSERRLCAVHSLQRHDLADVLRARLCRGAGETANSETQDGAASQDRSWNPPADRGRPFWPEGVVDAPLGAVVTAHVGAGTLAVAVAEQPDTDG